MNSRSILNYGWKALGYSRNTLYSLRNLTLRKMLKALPIRRFNIEVTERCDGNCIYCDIHSKSHLSELSSHVLVSGLRPRKLFEGVKEIGVTGGEPFLHTDLVGLCQTLKQLCPDTTFGLVTNGLRPEQILDTMLELRELDIAVHIGISLDGFSEVDGLQRGNPVHSKKAWRTYHLLSDAGFDAGFGSVITGFNIKSMLAFRCGLSALKIHHGIMTANPSEHFYKNTGYDLERLRITDLELFTEICHSGHVCVGAFFYPKYLREQRQIFPCFSGFNSFFLAADATVYPCISLNRVWGNIEEDSFGKIWLGRKAQDTRKMIVDGGCHCYTGCELAAGFEANVFPVLSKGIQMLPHQLRRIMRR